MLLIEEPLQHEEYKVLISFILISIIYVYTASCINTELQKVCNR
ncbi:hypothetical protein QEW_0980 [Clostridioides difficile CD160]|nr:hypothetical protein QEW_0980 [Clostridioides difficile CD160]